MESHVGRIATGGNRSPQGLSHGPDMVWDCIAADASVVHAEALHLHRELRHVNSGLLPIYQVIDRSIIVAENVDLTGRVLAERTDAQTCLQQ